MVKPTPVPHARGFRVVSERTLAPQDERLWLAVRCLKEAYELPRTVDDMAKEIMRTERELPNLIAPHPGMLAELLRDGVPEVIEAIRAHTSVKSPRKVRHEAEWICSTRRNRRGAPDKYDPEVVRTFCATVERIAGRELSYSHRRHLHAPGNEPTTDPPHGPMLCVLLAALDWAFTQFQPHFNHPPVKAEAVLTVIKNARRTARQN